MKGDVRKAIYVLLYISVLVISSLLSYRIGLEKKLEYPHVTGSSILLQDTPPERPSPKQRIGINNVSVYGSSVVLRIDNPKWAVFTNTNSMDPVIDEDAMAIEVDARCEDISVGDIVSYETSDGIIIHRVIDIGYDNKGKYFIMKGDNADVPDPYKVRCEQLRRVVVAILY